MAFIKLIVTVTSLIENCAAVNAINLRARQLLDIKIRMHEESAESAIKKNCEVYSIIVHKNTFSIIRDGKKLPVKRQPRELLNTIYLSSKISGKLMRHVKADVSWKRTRNNGLQLAPTCFSIDGKGSRTLLKTRVECVSR